MADEPPFNSLKPGTVQSYQGGPKGRINGVRRHGSISCYNAGCRCPECREARRLYALSDRGSRAHRMARDRITKWAVHRYPGVYARLLAEALDELDDDRG